MKTPQKNDYLDLSSVRFTFEDIHKVIDAFYREVAVDHILKVPFSSVEDWPHHVDRLIHFWWTRFGGAAYMQASYNPIEKHYQTGFNDVFLKRWLGLFNEILNKYLTPDQVNVWNSVATNMGSALARNNDLMILRRGAYAK